MASPSDHHLHLLHLISQSDSLWPNPELTSWMTLSITLTGPFKLRVFLRRRKCGTLCLVMKCFTNHISSLNSLFCRFITADVLNLAGNISMSQYCIFTAIIQTFVHPNPFSSCWDMETMILYDWAHSGMQEVKSAISSDSVLLNSLYSIISSTIQDLCHYTKALISQQLLNRFYSFPSTIHMANAKSPIFKVENKNENKNSL